MGTSYSYSPHGRHLLRGYSFQRIRGVCHRLLELLPTTRWLSHEGAGEALRLGMHQMLTSKQRDYKWSLVYDGQKKTYQLTEHRLIDGDWVKLNSSDWNTMESVLNHIEVSNEKRMKDGRP